MQETKRRLCRRGQSRIYLGVHWGFDRDEGIKSGKNVADYVFDNFLQLAP